MTEPAARTAPRLVWSVSALLQAVGDALTARWPTCMVHGEIAGWSRAASGHAYFNLKDGDQGNALLRCAMFRRAGMLLDFDPADGQRVELRGRLAIYEPRGELQFVVEAMRRAGEGTLYEQYLRRKARLEAEGLFDPSRKRELPRHPRRIGIVTSADAAALRDVAVALARRAPHVAAIVYATPVQGAAAPAQIVAALATAAQRDEVDVVLLVRGGGSLEDLWAFNDEAVVRAVASLPMPVVCGVGHETDVTLADFAADVRAPTPTAAAELVAPTREALQDELEGVRVRLQRAVRAALDGRAQWLDRTVLRLARPAAVVLRHRDRLDGWTLRLRGAMPRHREWQGRRLDALGARLGALDPRRVLARGYAWLSDAGGTPITSVHRVAAGDTVQATLADGGASLRVLAASPDRTDD